MALAVRESDEIIGLLDRSSLYIYRVRKDEFTNGRTPPSSTRWKGDAILAGNYVETL